MASSSNRNPDSPIIEPAFFGKFYRKVSERIFIFFRREEMNKFAAMAGYAGSRPGKGRRSIGPVDYLPGKTKDDYGLAGPIIGAPAAVISLEFLAACGAREIICFGVCGSIDPSVRIGDLVTPRWAVGEEGTSRLYSPDSDRFDCCAGLSEKIAAAFEAKGARVKSAGCWTTDAFFRETPAKVEKYRNLGASVVDMEASALFAVAAHRGVKLACLFVVSDELFDGRWRPGFMRPLFIYSRWRALRLLNSFRQS